MAAASQQEGAAPGAQDPLLAQLNKQGYVVVRSVLTAEQLGSLRAAAASATALARAGAWPRIRTVGKQFPPWPPAPGPEGIWGVQALLHPDLPGSDVFARLYFSDAVLSPARRLLRCADDELVLELCNMLVRPGPAESPDEGEGEGRGGFALRWHRDDVGPDAGPDEELARLREPAWHAQWNLALYDDASLVLVPGSHRRARTEAERRADPHEPAMPGQLAVALAPGDIAFYDNNILHRGVYDARRERMTLHGSVGHVGGSRLRARNVLQHGVGEWVGRCDFSHLPDGERERAEAMRERLIKMGKESGGEVGYSLKG